jgi:hypothetical protein
MLFKVEFPNHPCMYVWFMVPYHIRKGSRVKSQSHANFESHDDNDIAKA